MDHILSPREVERYARHLELPAVGHQGQERLKAASVLIVGAGGLGTPAALYLAAAGVGRIGLVDDDRVELSNLQRQVIYGEPDVGRPKVEIAERWLQRTNSLVRVTGHAKRFDRENAKALVPGYDLVVDGTDTFEARYAINDACVAARVPDVFASVSQFEGQVSVFAAPGGPCYRCIFPSPPPPHLVPPCREGGVLGVLPGLLGLLQATEALKLLLGVGEPLVGRLLLVDALPMRFQTLQVARDPACPVCSGEALRIPPSSPSSQPVSTMSAIPEITVHELHRMREQGQPPFLLDVRRPDEYTLANLEGALIPLQQLPERVAELEVHRDDPMIVVHCRSGTRSAQAVELLRRHGFENVHNLRGGILAWSDEIDPSVPKY